MHTREIERLVKKASNKDPDAFAQIYSCFAQGVYYFALHILKNEDSANDIVQETMLSLYQNLNTIKNPRAIKGFINTTAYNFCMMNLREKQAVFSDDDSIFENIEETSEEFIPEEYVTKKELRQEITNILDSLPESQRVSMMLYYFRGLSTKSIAEMLNVTDDVVRRRLSRARKAMKLAIQNANVKGVVVTLITGIPLLTKILNLESDAAFSADLHAKNWAIIGNKIGFSPSQIISSSSKALVNNSFAYGAQSSSAVLLGNAIGGKLLVCGIIASGVMVSSIALPNVLKDINNLPGLSVIATSNEKMSPNNYDFVVAEYNAEQIYVPTFNDAESFGDSFPPKEHTDTPIGVDNSGNQELEQSPHHIIKRGTYMPVSYPIGSAITIQDIADRSQISVAYNTSLKVNYFDEIDPNKVGEHIIYFTAFDSNGNTETVAVVVLVGEETLNNAENNGGK